MREARGWLTPLPIWPSIKLLAGLQSVSARAFADIQNLFKVVARGWLKSPNLTPGERLADNRLVRFFRYELRTPDVEAARDFYSDVFGVKLWDSGVSVVPLPETAAARGAPAHWLGHIGVADVEAAAGRVVAAGGQRLGPPAVRDPFGAVLALGSETEVREVPAVVLRVHHSPDRERASGFYSGLFGSTDGQTFVTADSPRIHSQWLFFFEASDFEGSMAKIRARGGLVLEPRHTPGGDLAVACDDPQGAAFGLIRCRG
jgi:predicted enzyme related to lactoylglutathione lyase